MWTAILLSACPSALVPPQIPALPASPAELTLRSSFSGGDTYGIWGDPTQGVAYVGEGAQVTILTTSGLPAPGACIPRPTPLRVPVEATVQALVRHDSGSDHALFIAGGSFGLLKMDVDPTSPTFQDTLVVDDRERFSDATQGFNERWCSDVAITSVAGVPYVLALFSAEHGLESAQIAPAPSASQLRIYKRSSLALTSIVELDHGFAALAGQEIHRKAFAYRLAARDDLAVIAMGTGGLLEVRFSNPAAPTVSRRLGPFRRNSGSLTGSCKLLPATFNLGNRYQTTSCEKCVSCTLAEPGCVRDVAIDGRGAIFAAVDTWGLVEVDSLSFKVLQIQQLEVSGTTGTTASHAVRVEAVSRDVLEGSELVQRTYVLVGGRVDPARVARSPFSVVGTFLDSAATSPEAICPGETLPGVTLRNRLFLFQRDVEVCLGSPTPFTRLHTWDDHGSGGNLQASLGGPGGDVLQVFEQIHEFENVPLAKDTCLVGTSTPDPATAAGSSHGLRYFEYTLPGSPSEFARDPLWVYRGVGLQWIDAYESEVDPTIVFGLFDPSSNSDAGLDVLDIANSSAPQGLGRFFLEGTFAPDAHWIDPADPRVEWVISAVEKEAYRLNRIEHCPTRGVRITTYRFLPALTQDGYTPLNYLRAFSYSDSGEDRVLALHLSQDYGSPCKNPASPWGGTLYRASTLMARFNALMGSPLSACPATPVGLGACATPPFSANEYFLFDKSYELPVDCGAPFATGLASAPCITKANSSTLYVPNHPIDLAAGTFDETFLALVETHPELACWNKNRPAVEQRTYVYNGEALIRPYVNPINGQTEMFALVAAGSNSNSQDGAYDASCPEAPHAPLCCPATTNGSCPMDQNADCVADDPDYLRPMLTLVNLSAPPICANYDVEVPTCNNSGPGCAHDGADDSITPGCDVSALATALRPYSVPLLPSTSTAMGPAPAGPGDDARGLSVALDFVELQTGTGSSTVKRRFAFVADLNGRLLLFDVTDTAAPRYQTQWRLPPSVIDGAKDNVFDVVVDLSDAHDGLNEGQAESYVYFTAWRVGVIRLRLTIQPSTSSPFWIQFPPELPSTLDRWQAAAATGVVKVDSPGLAHSLRRRHKVGGTLEKGFLLSDGLGGLRILGAP